MRLPKDFWKAVPTQTAQLTTDTGEKYSTKGAGAATTAGETMQPRPRLYSSGSAQTPTTMRRTRPSPPPLPLLPLLFPFLATPIELEETAVVLRTRPEPSQAGSFCLAAFKSTFASPTSPPLRPPLSPTCPLPPAPTQPVARGRRA